MLLMLLVLAGHALSTFWDTLLGKTDTDRDQMPTFPMPR